MPLPHLHTLAEGIPHPTPLEKYVCVCVRACDGGRNYENDIFGGIDLREATPSTKLLTACLIPANEKLQHSLTCLCVCVYVCVCACMYYVRSHVSMH